MSAEFDLAKSALAEWLAKDVVANSIRVLLEHL